MSTTAPQPASKPRLRERLERGGTLAVAVEIVTSRGLVTAKSAQRTVELVQQLALDPRIDVISITDNPGGHAMLAPDTLGTDLVSRGQEVIIHLATKDWNRNALESRAWKLASEGFDNVLALSGDYARQGHRGQPAPVFDIDSVGLLKLLSDMNAGLPDQRRPGERLEPTNFFLGCVVTNHKRLEREVVPQYLKLGKKARAGARFVINQIGYNARKDDELLRYIRHAQLALAERYGAGKDAGRSFFIDLAAKQAAVARGLGFQGIYLGGHASAETFFEILQRAEGYAREWRAVARDIRFERPGEFYMFERDPDTGLSSDELSRAYVESKRRRQTELPIPAAYRLSRGMHRLLFDPQAPLFGAGRRLYERLEAAGPAAMRAAHGI